MVRTWTFRKSRARAYAQEINHLGISNLTISKHLTKTAYSLYASQRTFSTSMIGTEQYQFMLQTATEEDKNREKKKSINIKTHTHTHTCLKS